MILVVVLLHFFIASPCATLYLKNRFHEELFWGEKNLSYVNTFRTEVNADNAQDELVRPVPHAIVETLPVGQGDATIIICPVTHPNTKPFISLIDMGSMQFKYGPMEWEAYVEKIDGMLFSNNFKDEGPTIPGKYVLKHIFLTHPDKDHLNYGYEKGKGLLPKLKARYDNLPPLVHHKKPTIHISSQAIWKDIANKTQTTKNPSFFKQFWTFLETLKGEDDKYFYWNDYQKESENIIPICGIPIEENIPSMKIVAANLGNQPNEMSMVLSLHYPTQNEYIEENENVEQKRWQGKMLFMGDFQGEKEYKTLTENNGIYSKFLPADVVMLPHHGTATLGNGDPIFYELVGAKHAIVSSHILTKHEHPALQTLAAVCVFEFENNYHPSYTCPLWDECSPDEIKTEMGQCWKKLYNYKHNDNTEMRIIGGGLASIYDKDKDGKDCEAKIYQTTKLEKANGQLETYIVETKLYRDIGPEITSKIWP